MEDSSCTCGYYLETREHILIHCPNYTRPPAFRDPAYKLHIKDLIEFLGDNPLAFAFRPPAPTDEAPEDLVIEVIPPTPPASDRQDSPHPKRFDPSRLMPTIRRRR